MSPPIYNPDRTYCVDSVGSNHLIRGNQPLLADGTTFAYDALNTKLKSILGGGFDLTQHKLIDVSIIDDNPDSERPLLEAEFAAYGIGQAEFDDKFPFPAKWPPYLQGVDVQQQYGTEVQGHPGSIVWYPVQGCTDLANCEQVEPPQFDFIGMIDFLRSLLETESKAVVYVHCEHGHDRTSAVTAAYMIKYMGRTKDQALNDGPPEGAKAFKHDWETNYEALVDYYATKTVSTQGGTT